MNGSPMDGCLLDVDHPDRSETTRSIVRIRRRYPRWAVVAFTDSRPALEYYDLGELGVHGIVSATQPPATIRSVVDRALTTARADIVAESLASRLPAPGAGMVAWAVEHAGADASVARLGAAFGHTPESLRAALRRLDMPSPATLLLWGRLLVAAARLERDAQTVEEVAFSLGYSTANSLSRAMKRHAGLTPSEVAERGGMATVQDALFPAGARGGAIRSVIGRTTLSAFAFVLALGLLGAGGGPPLP
jgi:AraC-like DNA-binding protein